MGKLGVRALLAMTVLAAGTSLHAQEGRKLISHPAPAYPEAARKFSLSGVVKVQVVIAADGHVKDIKVIGGHPMLVLSVQETLKTWQYAPASGETTATLEFTFHP